MSYIANMVISNNESVNDSEKCHFYNTYTTFICLFYTDQLLELRVFFSLDGKLV